MSLRRVGAAAAVSMAGVALGSGAWAWACTPQPRVLATSAESGPSRSAVTVRGEAVAPAGPVELRWDGVRGPVIGTALADANGHFAAQAAIPDASAGVHAIVVVAQGAGLGRSPFEVTPSSASTASAARPSSPWSASGTGSPSEPGVGGLLIGAGLLGVGAAVLSGGAAAAVVGRRRVPVGARSIA